MHPKNVALRNGMSLIDTITTHYRGVDMPHMVFCVKKMKPNKKQIIIREKFVKQGKQLPDIFFDEFVAKMGRM